MNKLTAVTLVLALAAPARAEPPPASPDPAAPTPTAATTPAPIAAPSRPPEALLQPSVEPAPFGPGASLLVTSSAEPLTVYVAKVDPTRAESLPDSAFVKVGRTPLSMQLPPGTYRIEVEGPGISNAGMLFEMRGEPRKLLARPGSEGLGVTGTLFTAAGVLGLVGATAILASGSKAPSNFNKTSVLVPMYAAGAVLLGAGIGMSIAGSTNLEEPPRPSAPPPTPAGPRALLTFGARF